MTQVQRHQLETTAAKYLHQGKIERSVAMYRQLGQPAAYVRKLREQADESLRRGDASTAVAAYIAASCLSQTKRR